MELAGPRGALITGGAVIAASIAAGQVLHRRRTVNPVALPAKAPAPQPALQTAA